jgi:hypothetical protein
MKEGNNYLKEVLKKNIYGTVNPKKDEVKYIEKYIKAFLSLLNSTQDDQVKTFFKKNMTIKNIS